MNLNVPPINGNTDDDYELDSSELIDDSSFFTPDMMYQPMIDSGLNHHAGYQDFDFQMDMTQMDHLVDANSLNLHFEDQLNVAHDMGAFCGSFPIQQKYYPSPPYESATMMDLSGQMPFSISPEHSHM
ncbi:10793_t:CDS:2 [Acaulospora colombiana]|uniref:10793_t:CDS:1 n=1 Tax=Acaulospora colombiana TaxID=27376 RepID=A0ACA9KHN3_9GLOM|nr:10793_t:CDS:2 [Acaulospora colombiana]